MSSTYSLIRSLWSSNKSRTLWLQRAHSFCRHNFCAEVGCPLCPTWCQCLSGPDFARFSARGAPQIKRWSFCLALTSTLLPDRCHGTVWCCLLVEPTPRGACPEQDNTLAGGSRCEVALETQKLHWKQTNVAICCYVAWLWPTDSDFSLPFPWSHSKECSLSPLTRSMTRGSQRVLGGDTNRCFALENRNLGRSAPVGTSAAVWKFFKPYIMESWWVPKHMPTSVGGPELAPILWWDQVWRGHGYGALRHPVAIGFP